MNQEESLDGDQTRDANESTGRVEFVNQPRAFRRAIRFNDAEH